MVSQSMKIKFKPLRNIKNQKIKQTWEVFQTLQTKLIPYKNCYKKREWSTKLAGKKGLADVKTMPYWKQSRKTRLTVDVSPFALAAILEQKLKASHEYNVVAYTKQAIT